MVGFASRLGKNDALSGWSEAEPGDCGFWGDFLAEGCQKGFDEAPGSCGALKQ